MLNSKKASPKNYDKLQEILSDHQSSDLEYHLPKEILDMDKAALLSLVYRLLQMTKD
jgi:hypothetical protein